MGFLLRIRLRILLPALVIFATALSTILSGGTSYFIAQSSLVEESENKLLALAESRKNALRDYLKSIEADLLIQAANPTVTSTLEGYINAWDKLGENQKSTLQNLYIISNPNPTGKKQNLFDAKDGSDYSAHHAQTHGWFLQLQQMRDYYDVFLFDTEGNLVYSVFKELDYATNLNTGKWKDSGLGKVYRSAMKQTQQGQVAFEDFHPYAPSFDAPASFIASAVFTPSGKKIGVLTFQMPIGMINNLMQQAAGMGESGETYIVGSDLLMRSDSRFSEESSILKIKVDGETSRAALEGNSGVAIVEDYRGINVVSAYAPLSFHRIDWGILAEMDESEVLTAAHELRNWTIGILIVTILIAAAIGTPLGIAIASRISNLVEMMSQLGSGKLDIEIPDIKENNVFGRMLAVIINFKDSLIENNKLSEENAKEQEKQINRASVLRKLVEDFDSDAQNALTAVSGATGQMKSSSDELGQTVSETSELATGAAESTALASSNVETVAAAAEELAASVQEISAQVQRSTEIASHAVHEANRGDQLIKGLEASTMRIGEILTLISEIADQTNLLALNATIEAARAGDAGKGFAVVANEVKSLATQTANATGEISSQISQIQSDTKETVTAIQSIGKIIGEMNEITSSVSAAVEEQGAATQEIARNTQQASMGTNEVSEKIVEVNRMTDNSDKVREAVLDATNHMITETDKLKQNIDKFLREVSVA
ncbi:methyl-accepting chemotaxis protein [Curvivirga aplysinae]|uniref:methyl-accepting chemotaxis protein n=1 Tax=Curvivirga aplysinae TaxID=2529852 RepID=UPI0012BB6C09|nr:methyl-accepting chemotaxis protein [Curvivirga aplysinae]MTI09202.1 methyl-accepting chemotaxis protein [Curvivirga aplysinae]